MEVEKLALEEAKKPKMTDYVTLTKAQSVDAVVVGQNGLMLKFMPFVTGFDDQVFEIRYPAGMPNDTIIMVTCQSTKSKSLIFSGSPKLK
ncbi:MAG TPA: hypothetical protein PLY70_07475 [Saprospiraceae bacterium]|nr:hypothetical protein [Saprospiraceae bacterium]